MRLTAPTKALVLLLIGPLASVKAFLPSGYAIRRGCQHAKGCAPTTIVLKDAKKWEEEIDEKSRMEAATKATPGATVAGAVLGGLLLGPFGAVFGASIGGGVGRQKAQDEARQKEMERLGLSPDMLAAAREIGEALERNMEGLTAVQESYETQKRFAQRLDADANELYDKAKAALESDDEESARKYLLERGNAQEKLKDVLTSAAVARKQVEQMEANGVVLKNKAIEIDTIMRRSVGAKAVQDSSDLGLGLSLSNSDPLLQRFKDMGID